MILEERTLINATPNKIFEFFDNMEENFTAWHPDHIVFQWVKGRGVAIGNVFYFEEIIAGEYQKKSVVFTEVQKNKLITFAPTNDFFRLFLPRISFTMNEAHMGTELIAEVVVRMGPVAKWLHRKQIRLVKQHMSEEGKNVKRILESI